MGQAKLSQAERTELSDARMLDAAVQLIVEHGTVKTTLKDVGELAGYSRGLAGYRFGNKAGLYEFVVRSIGEKWLKALTKATEGLTGYDAIEAAIDTHYCMCVKAPKDVRAFYTLWFGAIGPGSEVKQVISNIHARRHQDVEQWVEQGIHQGTIDPSVNADAFAGQFGSASIGIIYQWLINPEDLNSTKRLYDNLKHTVQLWLMRP